MRLSNTPCMYANPSPHILHKKSFVPPQPHHCYRAINIYETPRKPSPLPSLSFIFPSIHAYCWSYGFGQTKWALVPCHATPLPMMCNSDTLLFGHARIHVTLAKLLLCPNYAVLGLRPSFGLSKTTYLTVAHTLFARAAFCTGRWARTCKPNSSEGVLNASLKSYRGPQG